MDDERRIHLEELLRTHRANLHDQKHQAALHGITVPQSITSSIRHELEQIARIEAELTQTKSPQLLDNRRDNLPAPTTRLIGRDSKVKEVLELLQNVRHVTLTGPGGTGKTRLALAAATTLRDDSNNFADGVYFVALAPIRNTDLVIPTIAETLGVRDTGGRPLFDLLKNTLRDRKLLLVLDNFEQIVEAGPWVSELLEFASGLKVLVTSRAALKLNSEYEFIVPPLDLPEQKQLPPLAQLAEYGAIRLFVERAQAANRDFSLTAENAVAITEICARLDGLPLAIVLAAARSKQFTPQRLLAQLQRPLMLLTGGARDLPERQQTLRNTIDWSYSLLDESERALFQRLAVFAGGCTIEAAEAICNATQRVPGELPFDVFDGLAALVDESLLRQIEDAQGEPRFIMLETIREYAQEQLAASRQEDEIRKRHAHYYLKLAETAAPKLITSDQAKELKQLELEHNNLREALRVSEASLDNDQALLRMVAALWRFWDRRCHLDEARKWQEVALNSGGPQPALIRAQALLGASAIARDRGELDRWNTYITEARDLFQTIDGKAGKAGKAEALVEIGYLALYRRRYRQATRPIKDGLTLAHDLDNTWLIAWAHDRLGDAARCLNNPSEAIAQYTKALELFRSADVQDDLGMACSLHKLGDAKARQLDTVHQATIYLAESMKLFRGLGDQRGVAECLEGWAFAAQTSGHKEAAVRLLGAADALRTITQTRPQHADRDELDDAIATAKRQLGDTYDAAWAAGRAMSLEQAIAYALEPFPATDYQ